MKLWTLWLIAALNGWAMSGYDVAKKSDAVLNGFEDARSDMTMTLINAGGQERVRHMKMQVLEGDQGDKSLMEFLSPADVKGAKFLNYEHLNKDDDQWLYLPALKRVKRIASRNKSGAFMGSEFSYEDLSAFNVDKYTYAEGEAQTRVEGGKTYWIVPRIPIDDNSGYTKQISWIDADTFLIRKVEYFDRKSALLKTAEFGEYRKIGGVWRIGRITMTNHQNDKKTILIWENETIKNGLKDRDFHKRVLKR